MWVLLGVAATSLLRGRIGPPRERIAEATSEGRSSGPYIAHVPSRQNTIPI
jgi:hypothetical protein